EQRLTKAQSRSSWPDSIAAVQPDIAWSSGKRRPSLTHQSICCEVGFAAGVENHTANAKRPPNSTHRRRLMASPPQHGSVGRHSIDARAARTGPLADDVFVFGGFRHAGAGAVDKTGELRDALATVGEDQLFGQRDGIGGIL